MLNRRHLKADHLWVVRQSEVVDLFGFAAALDAQRPQAPVPFSATFAAVAIAFGNVRRNKTFLFFRKTDEFHRILSALFYLSLAKPP
jgi:hypothetical protein